MVKLFIKNMVCDRCVLVVRQELEKLGVTAERITLGEVDLMEDLPEEKLKRFEASLKELGFERLDDRKARVIESIKQTVIEIIHHSESQKLKTNWSTLLSEKLHYDYNYLSSLFSSVEGVTLEQYIIRQKIEKVKELLFYNELTLSEIAYQLGYSSVAHLSGQFKKVTGFTPSQMKKGRNPDATRKPLDRI